MNTILVMRENTWIEIDESEILENDILVSDYTLQTPPRQNQPMLSQITNPPKSSSSPVPIKGSIIRAVRQGNIERVRAHVACNKPELLNCQESSGKSRTLLHLAVDMYHEKLNPNNSLQIKSAETIFWLLLQGGADLARKNKKGNPPLHGEMKHLELCRRVWEQRKNYCSNTSIHEGCFSIMAKYLLKSPSVHKQELFELFSNVKSETLAKFADSLLNHHGKYPIHVLADEKQPYQYDELATLLLAHVTEEQLTRKNFHGASFLSAALKNENFYLIDLARAAQNKRFDKFISEYQNPPDSLPPTNQDLVNFELPVEEDLRSPDEMKLDELTQRLGRSTQYITDCQNEIYESKERIDKLIRHVDDMASQIAKHSIEVGDLKEQIDALNSKLKINQRFQNHVLQFSVAALPNICGNKRSNGGESFSNQSNRPQRKIKSS